MSTLEAPGTTEGRRASSKRGYLLPGGVALAALLAIGLVLGAGDLDHRAPSTLSGPDISRTISFAIQASDGSRMPPQVTCPASEPVRQGWVFACSLVSGGHNLPVKVTEVDGHGRLSWSVGPAK